MSDHVQRSAVSKSELELLYSRHAACVLALDDVKAELLVATDPDADSDDSLLTRAMPFLTRWIELPPSEVQTIECLIDDLYSHSNSSIQGAWSDDDAMLFTSILAGWYVPKLLDAMGLSEDSLPPLAPQVLTEHGLALSYRVAIGYIEGLPSTL